MMGVNMTFSRTMLARLRRWARYAPRETDTRGTRTAHVHAKLTLAQEEGRGVRLTADEVDALVMGDSAVCTAGENCAIGDYGEPPDYISSRKGKES